MSDIDKILHVLGSGFAQGPKPTKRDMAMIGFSKETKRKIQKAIELDPALEELILHIAENAFLDGQESLS